MTEFGRPRLGISSCLLGEKVRFNGGHKRDRFVTDTLGEYCDWVMVCPEFEMGLGAPRETMRLVGDPENPRLLEPATGIDRTAAMRRWNKARLAQLRDEGLHGFILKKDSPTCGMQRVKVWHEGGGGSERKGVGMWAAGLRAAFPLLPCEEEGRLNDMRLRENFIERVFAYRRWRETFQQGRRRRADLVNFHTDHKLTLMAHSPEHYRQLGRIVAGLGTRPLREDVAEYGELFMRGLERIATTRKHTNVLQHVQGYFKRSIDAEDKKELADTIFEYHAGQVPLVVPLTLIRHHLRRHPHPWLERQTYLHPYPAELMLRNHV